MSVQIINGTGTGSHCPGRRRNGSVRSVPAAAVTVPAPPPARSATGRSAISCAVGDGKATPCCQQVRKPAGDRQPAQSLPGRPTRAYRPDPHLDLADAGMSTVEYAVGTVVAAAFAAVLYKIVTGDSVVSGLTALVRSALDTTF